MKDKIMHAFGNTPDIFTRRVESTLLRLEERPMKKTVRKSAIIAIAALITLLGIAAAAGSTYLFDVFGKQPLDGAEDCIVEVASDPIKVNDDITATVDKVYYDGTEILYEMTLTLTDPEKYALTDCSAFYPHEAYTPPTGITHILIAPQLFYPHETHEFLDAAPYQHVDINYSDNVVLEEIGAGVYKLYGYFTIYPDEDQPAMLNEMDLDLDLNLTYATDDREFRNNQEAAIPFHVARTARTKVFTLTPKYLPEGLIVSKAILTATDAGARIEIAYDFGSPLLTGDEFIYDFHLQDPDDPGEYTGKSFFSHDPFCYNAMIELPAMEHVPDLLIFDVVRYDMSNDHELPVATVEFTVTEAD